MDGVVLFYLAAAATLVAGVLWFRVVRPMLEGFGLIDSGEAGVRSEPLPSRESVKDKPEAAANLTEAQPAGEMPRTSTVLVRISDTEPPTKPLLTDRAFVEMLAAAKKVDGSYWLSANKIYDQVGGPRADVLAWVRAVRDGGPASLPSDDAQPARVLTVRDRDGAREIPMTPRRERYYDDPEMEYKAPAV